MLRILKAAWTHRHRLGDQRRSALTLEFLPAALEIRERPPHPGNRVTAWLLMGLFASGLLWACLGQVDIVATAEGKLVPSGQVKLIQPYERGVVSRIHISEGQQVRRGDALVDLDNTLTGADESRLSQDLLQSQLGIVRLKAYLSSLAESGSRPAVAPPEWSHAASADQVSPHRQLLEQQVGSYRAQLAQLTRKLESKRAEQAINHAKIARLTRTLPLITQRTQALESLSERQLVARVSYLELEQNRIEQQYELSAAKARARQLDAEVEELRQQRASLVAATRGKPSSSC
ncbi:hypothetical protein [Marinobacterium aestuariivivens]|uniref:CyaD-like alpha-helical hairpin domain-containing protein n=1 Tax=Marinobacterium aestuariivivens TaxID=1698799 RepID=A0ABW1ZWT6_9GAMM